MIVYGTNGSDYLEGTDSDDSIFGLAGTDTLSGGAGNDALDGGGGSDYLDGSDGANILDGGGGDDYFFVFWGDASDSDLLIGGSGSDRFYVSDYNQGVVTIADFSAGVGGDIIEINQFIYSAIGYSAGNPFDPTVGYLQLVQNGADALLQWDRDGAGAGDNGWQTVLTLQGFNLTATPLTAENFSPRVPLDGSNQGLTLTGDDGDNSLQGSWGDDTLYGLAGGDTLHGDKGDDYLDGGDGGDLLYGDTGNDTLLGGGGDDSFKSGYGSDILDGGGESKRGDTYYCDANSMVVVDLVAGTAIEATIDGTAETDTLIAIEHVIGGILSDSISGNDESNNLYGASGSDTLHGGGGNDYLSDFAWYEYGYTDVNYLNGGDGDDYFSVFSGDANDTSLLTGGGGSDRFAVDLINQSVIVITDFEVGARGDVIAIDGISNDNAGNPFDPVVGYLQLVQNGADALLQWDRDGASDGDYGWQTLLTLQSLNLTATPLTMENFYSLAPPDGSNTGLTLIGDGGNNTLQGALVDDTLHGLAGDDALFGGAGNDVLDGGDDDDWLSGDAGSDTLTGGAGKDKFNFTSAGAIDTIADFVAIDDTIQLENAIFSALTVTGGLAADQFVVGAQALDANDFVIYNNTTGILSYDADGSGAGAIVQIAVLGAGLAMTNADITVI